MRAIDRWADGRASRATSGLSVPARGGQVTSWLAARIAGHSTGHRHKSKGEREREGEREGESGAEREREKGRERR